MITADHGNVEQMLDETTGAPHTAHTCNPVPIVLVNGPHSIHQIADGQLSDIAPTVLTILGLPIPSDMTGKSLTERGRKVTMLLRQILLVLFTIFVPVYATSQTSIHHQLMDLTAKIQAQEGQMMGIEQELNQIRQEEQTMLGQVDQWHQHLMETIDYLRHAAHYSPLLAMLSAAKLEDVIHSTILIRSLTPEMDSAYPRAF